MDVEFEKEYLSELYYSGKTSDKKHRFQPQVIKGYIRCVKALDEAINIEELFNFNSLNYEKLKGNKHGLSSLRIDKEYRLEFREILNKSDKKTVKICSLVDISNHYQ